MAKKQAKAFTESDLQAAGYVEYEPGKFAHRSKVDQFSITRGKISKSGKKKRKSDLQNGKSVSKIDLFVLLVKLELQLDVVQEHRFHPDRDWRFDYAILEHKIAIEQEGGVWLEGGGAHSRPENILRDMEKYTEAAVMGWVVIRRTPSQLQTKHTIELIKRAVEQITHYRRSKSGF